MENDQNTTKSKGRIEVAPEVIATIAHFAAIRVSGVTRTGTPPSNLFRRVTARHDGVLLAVENGALIFDIYVWIKAGINMVETSHAIQTAVVEAMDHMVGMPVESVNIHVENVAYDSDNTG